MSHKVNTLSVYRHFFHLNRGTPIRVRSLIKYLLYDQRINIHTASRDGSGIGDAKHIELTRNDWENIKILARYIKSNDIEVLIFHTLSSAYYLFPLIFLGVSCKFVLEMHGFLEEESKFYGEISKLKYYRNKIFYTCIYRFVHLITTCSDTATQKLKRCNREVYTVYGGVDLSMFSTKIKSFRTPTDSDKIIIGYSGNARKWQGLPCLLDAFEKISNQSDKYILRLLVSEKIEIRNKKNIEFYSGVPHEEVAAFNNSCDVLVIPRTDIYVNKISFPSKLMEYLASGKAVIGSSTSDIQNIITDNETGLLYKPGDVDGLVSCINKLSDSKFRDSLGRFGYEFVKNNYTWSLVGKRFADLVLKTTT